MGINIKGTEKSSHSDLLKQQLEDNRVKIDSLLAEYRDTFHISNKEEKKSTQDGIINKMYSEFPSLGDLIKKSEFHKIPRTEGMAVYLSNAANTQAIESVAHLEGSNPEALNDIFSMLQPKKVFLPTGETQTVQGKDSEGDLVDFKVDVPKFQEAELITIDPANLDGIVSAIQKYVVSNINSLKTSLSRDLQDTIPTESSPSEPVNVEWAVADTLSKMLEGNGKLSVVSPDGSSTANVDFADFTKRLNVTDHYLELANKFIEDFKKANGVELDYQDVEREMMLNDGSKGTQTVKTKQAFWTTNQGATEFAKTLLHSAGIKDSNGNQVNLFSEWTNSIYGELAAGLKSWIVNNEGMKVNSNNDSKFYDYFMTVISKVATEMASTYKSDYGWRAASIKNPFTLPDNQIANALNDLTGHKPKEGPAKLPNNEFVSPLSQTAPTEQLVGETQQIQNEPQQGSSFTMSNTDVSKAPQTPPMDIPRPMEPKTAADILFS